MFPRLRNSSTIKAALGCAPMLNDLHSVSELQEATATQTQERVIPKDFTDAGNAELFADRYSNRLLWCDALGWLVWDGKRWAADQNEAMAVAIEFSDSLLQTATQMCSDGVAVDAVTHKIAVSDSVKQFVRHAERSRSAPAIKNMLELTKAFLSVKAAELDVVPHYLNTDNNIIDLRNGKTYYHHPLNLCTKLAPFSPSADGAEVWMQFLAQITDGDEDLIEYLQTVVGMALFGEIYHEGIILAVGGGRNGKSTFFNAVSTVLGDYAGSIDSTILTTDRQNRGAALATLRGKRIVTCGELEEGQRLSVQTLKRLASTDALTIEEKFRQPETIKPSHHIFLFSNFLPRVGSTDNGTWRRLTVIPFNAVMPTGAKEIPNYAAYLSANCGGAILQWCIDGARAFYANGYRLPEAPAAVKVATDAYRQRENWVQNFLAERCIVEPSASVRCGALYDEYKQYAAESGDYCRRLADFNAAMESAGFRQIERGGRKKYWTGIRLDLTASNGYQAV